MAEGYDASRPYGKREGLEKRLQDYVHRLGADRQLPWVGLGMVDDLKCAIEVISGKPAQPAKPVLEFDL